MGGREEGEGSFVETLKIVGSYEVVRERERSCRKSSSRGLPVEGSVSFACPEEGKEREGEEGRGGRRSKVRTKGGTGLFFVLLLPASCREM